jgi:hypothetical protein
VAPAPDVMLVALIPCANISDELIPASDIDNRTNAVLDVPVAIRDNILCFVKIIASNITAYNIIVNTGLTAL